MNTKTLLFYFVILTLVMSLQALTVDSVKVDSIWNSDSSWTDPVTGPQVAERRDCFVSFKVVGDGTAQCVLAFSVDSGRSWGPSPNPIKFLDNGITGTLPGNATGRVKVRVNGGDRVKVAFKITAKQFLPLISSTPKSQVIGFAEETTPGQILNTPLKFVQDLKSQPYAPVTKSYWDALGDGTWDDSTDGMSWVWPARVPAGAAGQVKSVILKARDANGMWSLPCTLSIQIGLLYPFHMVDINAGSFQMGTPFPLDTIHKVNLTAYKISSTEVTQDLYTAVMNNNPSTFKSGPNYRVEGTSWIDAALFCNKLSQAAGFDTVYVYTGAKPDGSVLIDYTKNGYRLPTEAEWEYACRAGSTTDFFWGKSFPVTSEDTLTMDSYVAWYHSSPGTTQPVASKKPNAFGLYDMSGNVWEWVNDFYRIYYAAEVTNPTGPTKDNFGRVRRGGSYDYDAELQTSSFRHFMTIGVRTYDMGFRIARRP